MFFQLPTELPIALVEQVPGVADTQHKGTKTDPIPITNKSASFTVAYIFEGKDVFLAGGFTGDILEIGRTSYKMQAEERRLGTTSLYFKVPSMQMFLSGFIGFKENDESSTSRSAFGIGPRLSIDNDKLSLLLAYHFRLEDNRLIGRPMVGLGFRF